MQQLKMYWKAVPSAYPDNGGEFHYRPFTGDEKDVEAWTEICRNGLLGPNDGKEAFRTCILEHPLYCPESVFFVDWQGQTVATITALTDPKTKQGLVHMVGAHPCCRGRGVGNLLNRIAAARLWEQGCRFAFLTTDEFRVPAVKSYLREGFLPVEYDADMPARWENLLRFLGLTDVPMVNEKGETVRRLNQKQ